MDTHTTAIGIEPKRTTADDKRIAANDPLVRMKRFLLSEVAQKVYELEWSEEEDANLKAKAAQEMLDAAGVYQTLGRHDGSDVIAPSVAFHRTPCLGARYRPARTKGHRLLPEVIPDATCCDALNVALYDLCQYDDQIVLLGEDVGQIGSVFRTVALPEKLLDVFGLAGYRANVLQNYLPLIELVGERCLDTPLDEEGIAGVGVGLALAGKRPILEVQFSGFVYSMMDQIMTQMSRLPHRSAGHLPMPIVVRLPYGGGFLIEHHREEEVSVFLNNPGLTIVCPSTAQDFYSLLWAAVASEKPVLFFEPTILYRDQRLKGTLTRAIPTDPIEAFGIRIARSGHDVTVATFGSMVHTALEAATMSASTATCQGWVRYTTAIAPYCIMMSLCMRASSIKSVSGHLGCRTTGSKLSMATASNRRSIASKSCERPIFIPKSIPWAIPRRPCSACVWLWWPTIDSRWSWRPYAVCMAKRSWTKRSRCIISLTTSRPLVCSILILGACAEPLLIIAPPSRPHRSTPGWRLLSGYLGSGARLSRMQSAPLGVDARPVQSKSIVLGHANG